MTATISKIGFDCVENTERENACEATTNIFINQLSTLRRFDDPSDCFFHCGNELPCDLRLAFSIPERCFTVFLQSGRVKFISHPPSESRTFRRASSPDTVLTFPVRISSRRRFASTSHSCSIRPSSSPSRLSTRRSASCAHDSLGRDIACSATCSKVVAICFLYLLQCGKYSSIAIVQAHRREPRVASAFRYTKRSRLSEDLFKVQPYII